MSLGTQRILHLPAGFVGKVPGSVGGGEPTLKGERTRPLERVGSECHRMEVPASFLPSLAGEPVSVVGFGVFGQACGPSVTSGILSAVVHVDDTPVMLQTTCAVHGGSSGGPLFSTRSGDLLGN